MVGEDPFFLEIFDRLASKHVVAHSGNQGYLGTEPGRPQPPGWPLFRQRA